MTKPIKKVQNVHYALHTDGCYQNSLKTKQRHAKQRQRVYCEVTILE